MRILLISDYATRAGGAEMIILGLRQALRERGHDARLFATDVANAGAQNLADYTCMGTESSVRALLQTANPWAYYRLAQVLREFDPEVVHLRIFLTQLSPLILPLLRSVPTIYHVAWYRAICPTGTKLLPSGVICQSPPGPICLREGCLPLRDWAPLMLQLRMLERWRNCFDLIVANSHAVGAKLAAAGYAPIEVVHNGVPVAACRLQPAADPTVAFAGRLVPAKGVHILIDGFARVVQRFPKARLLIAGDGPERQTLAARAASQGVADRVAFLGQLPREALPAAFAGAWVQAVPSLWAEPFGIVAVEAMMQGLPVVASAAGGLNEIVEDGETGLLVPPGDAEALGHGLLALLGDRDRSVRMGRAGHARAVVRFSFDGFVDRFVGFYADLQRQTLGL